MISDRIAQYLKRLIKWPLEARTGRIVDRLQHYRDVEAVPSLAEVVSSIASTWPKPASDSDPPIFIVAAGWRSGSTLLQRLVMSSGEALIWGEPYNRCAYVQRLSESLVSLFGDYDLDGNVLARSCEAAGLDDEFIANLYPEREELLAAHRAFFSQLLAVPARERGYPRWGFKEVRLRPPHWRYLQQLFSNARIVVLVRHPYDAYRSYSVFPTWYEQWPETPVFTPGEYGELWRDITSGGLEDSEQETVLTVRFEDLTDAEERETTVKQIEAHLGVEIRREVFDQKVHGRGDTRPEPLPRSERSLLKKEVDGVAQQFGYRL